MPMRHDILYLSQDGERWLHAAGGGLSARTPGELARTPVAVIADYVEEALVRVTLPRILGRDMRALVDRRLQQEFRETGYRTAWRLGPGATPKTVEWLFLGLPNAATLDAHLRPLTESGRPLVGVWTVSQLAAAWIRRAGVQSPALLLVLPTPAGVRHIFLERGKPVLSRLIAAETSGDADATADAMADELLRTVHYLYNARRVERGLRIPVWLWGDEPAFAALAARDVEGVRFEPTPAVRGLPDPAREGLQALFRFAARRLPDHQLAPAPLRVHHFAARARRGTAIAAGLIVAALLGLAGLDFAQARRQQAETLLLQQAVAQAHDELARINAQLAGLGTDARSVREAIAAHERLLRSAPAFADGLALASLGFQASPAFVLDELHWRLADDGRRDDDQACPRPTAGDASPPGLRAGLALSGRLDAALPLRAALAARERFEAPWHARAGVALASREVPVDASGESVIRGGEFARGDTRTFAYCLELGATP
ncbi:MAG: hypothetical protein ACK4RW_09785 [Rehaibacterium terrae]|uniref:hypothetical protein n=1 Tax=Rehaibacterium terrae TaxID=1341696 RepID=UPI00391D46ED